MTLYNQLLLPVLLWENLNQCSEEKEFVVWSQCLEDRGIQSKKQFQQQSLLLTVIVLLITMHALYITSIHQLLKVFLGLLHIKKYFIRKNNCPTDHELLFVFFYMAYSTGKHDTPQVVKVKHKSNLSLDLRLCLCMHYSALPHRQL